MRLSTLYPVLILLAATLSCGGREEPENPQGDFSVAVSPEALNFSSEGGTLSLSFTADGPVQAYSNDSWISVDPAFVAESAGELTVTVSLWKGEKDRSGEVVVKCGSTRRKVPVVQKAPQMDIPEGYALVWNDEFDQEDGKVDASLWKYEVMAPRTVNDERQRYVDDGSTAWVESGALHIVARKEGKEVWSARLNSRESWLYGWVEARLWLPSGRGTWPAFWMMPADASAGWPRCGEIDIMEEVGDNPDVTTSSIHCFAYNHTKGTQKTAERKIPGLESEYHVYALEWTPERIQTYVDGEPLLRFDNDGLENADTWPFDKPFYIILNLAWGGSWGGQHGVDESALPCTYKVDYVRVFQKN